MLTPDEYTQFKRVRTESLIPVQAPVVSAPRAKDPFTTTRGFKTQADFYIQKCLKHPYVSYFHSYAEFLYASLLEADPNVVSFVPQPFRLRIDGKRYKPDFYFSSRNGQKAIELKPRGEMEDSKKLPLEAYFKFHQIEFKVISNEEVLEEEIKAKNWWSIIRTLLNYASIKTENLEYQLIDRFHLQGDFVLSDFIDWYDRSASLPIEVALFRLIHKGEVKIDCDKQPLNQNTEVYL